MRQPLALIAVAAAALGVLTAAQGGAFPGTNGLIAYSCGSSVCTAGPTGSGPAVLISSASDPAWSPNGAKIAFVKGSDIWTANADGTGQALFASGASEPTWSNDNATIAFVKTSDGHIWSKTSTTETQITSGSTIDADPSYSPNGTQIAYSSSSGSGATYHIYVKAANGTGSATQLTSGTSDEVGPTWAPGGATIVYSSSSALYKVPAAGGSSTALVNSADDPAYSPDGTQVVYWSTAPATVGNIAVVNSDGSNPHTIVTTSAGSQPDWGQAVASTPSAPGDTANGPKNTSYPTITLTSGDATPIVGHTLTAGIGTWSGTFPISYTYQWKRCDAADPVNGSCFNISGATSSSYTPAPADFGMRIRVAVTASNSDGRTTQNSEVTGVTGAIAVKLSSTPAISPAGTPLVDSTLTLSAGVWAGSTPIAFTYSWRRCNPVGDLGTCVPIVGAIASTYTPTIADIGFSLRVWITGTNLAGSDVAITNHTFPVVDKPHFAPSVVTPPTIGGVALPGRQLTANIGTYRGDSPIATPFHWYRCDANGTACHAIPGAGKVVYYPSSADVGYTLRLYVFAANAYGKLLALSDPTDAVAAAPPHVRGRRIVGTSRGDYIAGGGHDDTLIGLGGNDTILGGAGDDRIFGGPGNDVLTGGSGADRISGGPGSDSIFAADGERDVVDCGPGNDHAVVDAVDVVVDCEVVVKK